MKIRFHYILFALFTVILSCRKDNYEEPAATLSGRIVYKGEPFNFEYNNVNYELYQSSFGKTVPIGSVFTPEGGFSHVVFEGNYKLVVPSGQDPFRMEANSCG